MIGEPVEESYFNWLGAKVVRESQYSSYDWEIAHILHSTEFVWVVDGDANRAMDGLELRDEFSVETNIPCPNSWKRLGCSVLELMVGLARRAAFQTDWMSTVDWFWLFVRNLNINTGSRQLHPDEVIDILHVFMWRMYLPDGTEGGMFPLRDPTRDQREIELWYQLNDYLADQGWF